MRGQALVELALILPIMLLLLLGMIDFGRAYLAGVALQGAAREGARLAMDPAQSDTAVQARIQLSAQPVSASLLGISLCTATITPPATPPGCPPTGVMDPRDSSTGGKAVTVTVTTFVPFFTSFLTQQLGFTGIPITASANMQSL
jgi:Flp pilus assembly protein TadG